MDYPVKPAVPGRHLLHGRPALAVVIGFAFYLIGGWAFSFLYFVLFASLGIYTWWLGMAVEVLHGL